MSQNPRSAEIQGVIEAFKTILDLSPQDPTALDALADAYQQLGDEAQMIRHRILLGEAVLEQGDDAAAQHVAALLAPFEPRYSQVREFLARCGFRPSPADRTASNAAAAELARAAAARPKPKAPGFSMADELLFAWHLMQAKQLNGDEYNLLLKDMTERSAHAGGETVSVLHTLQACAFRNFEGVVAYVVQQTGTPFISLATVVLQYASLALMPLDAMRRQGVLPFGLIGKDALVCIMNPMNAKLKNRLIEEFARPCHFYVSLPTEFDEALARAADIIRDHTGAQS